MKSIDEVNQYLEKKIPRHEIYKRPGGGGRDLSYFEYWWTNHLLNQCFGNTGWSSETHEVGELAAAEPTYRAKVTIKAMVRTGDNSYLTIAHDGIGTCSGKDHEMAIKGAESDAFKRAAVKFGIRLGLGLYDKSEEFIDDNGSGKEAPTQSAGSKSQVQKTQGKPPVAPKTDGVQPKAETTQNGSREALNKLIRSTASVAFAKKALVDGEPWTLDRMKAKYQAEFGVAQTEDLTDEQADQVLEFLRAIIL